MTDDETPASAPPATDYHRHIMPDQERRHADWIADARAAAERIARTKGVVTSDDIWDVCEPPSDADPRCMAAVFAPRGKWERVGYVPSRRKAQNHGRPIAQWKLKTDRFPL